MYAVAHRWEPFMKTNKNILKGLVMISQIGISMMVPIFMCVFIGIQLDKWLSTNFLMIVFMIIGILAAFRNIYQLTKTYFIKDKEKEDAELKYFEDMKKERESYKK